MLMKRRDFIANVGATAILPSLALAQTKVWRIGMLDTASRELNSRNVEAFQTRLQELGYVEGSNLTVNYRSSDGRYERLPTLVTELLRLKPDLIVVRGTAEIIAVKNATTTIPIVMSAVTDPVRAGVAVSLSRPGGNVTGMASVTAELESKRVAYLKEILPVITRMALVSDLRTPNAEVTWREVQKAAHSLGIEAVRFGVRSAADVVRAFEAVGQEQVQAVRVGNDAITRPNRQLIVDLAAKHKVPAVYAAREFAEDGGLMSYSPDYPHLYSRAASLVDRVLKGEKPADLPIEQPTKFELVINLKAAKALGLTMPPSLLLLADEVIE
jgi:putative tryptophan/tyrosine transport system substrate-binding protein